MISMDIFDGWPCEYCKLKFKDIKFVIYHEIYLCEKNPKFKYTTLMDKKDKEINQKIINNQFDTKSS